MHEDPTSSLHETATTTAKQAAGDRSASEQPVPRSHVRRLSYFMLVRLAVLAAFTVVTGVVFYADEPEPDRVYAAFVWGTLVIGYALTIVWARQLPRVRNLERFAALQTFSDIILSAVVVQMTGGTASGFVFLYLICVLGAATMAGRQLTFVSAATSAVIYTSLSSLEFAGLVTPLTHEPWAPMQPLEHWMTAGRTLAALLGVTVLSSYLSTQLTTSASQIGNLRALNEHIVRSLNSGLITTDLNDAIVYFNPAAQAILELDERHIGLHIDALFPAGGTFAGGPPSDSRREVQVTTSSRRTIHIGLSRSALVNGDGQCIGHVVNFQDLTRLHELAQRVRRHERLAALGGLAASVAHEIRNPLAAISGSAELLDALDLEDEDRRLLRIVQRESTRLSNMVTELLSFTRPKTPQKAKFDLGRTVREACEAFAADPANDGVCVEWTCASPVSADADPAQISQVLWNLMRNAAEAIGGAGRVQVSVTSDDALAVVEVRDDGPGIATEIMESVFDPFFTTKEGGTGFGLAIVHRIIEDNGGSVSVTSTPGGGSTFRIELPSAMTVASDEPPSARPPANMPPRIGAATALRG